MSSLRIILDTNVLVSGITFPASTPGKIVIAWRRGSIDVLLSRYILEELRRVLPRLAHRHQLSSGEIDDLVEILAFQAEIIEPSAVEDASLRDPKDQPVLATLTAALQTTGAKFLITGDRDLLALSSRYPIVTPADFWARHGGI